MNKQRVCSRGPQDCQLGFARDEFREHLVNQRLVMRKRVADYSAGDEPLPRRCGIQEERVYDQLSMSCGHNVR